MIFFHFILFCSCIVVIFIFLFYIINSISFISHMTGLESFILWYDMISYSNYIKGFSLSTTSKNSSLQFVTIQIKFQIFCIKFLEFSHFLKSNIHYSCTISLHFAFFGVNDYRKFVSKKHKIKIGILRKPDKSFRDLD